MRTSWIRQLFNTQPRRKKIDRASKPHLKLELLEDRVVPTTYVWTGASSGVWNLAANWDVGGVTATTYPKLAGDIAQFTGSYSSAQTVSITAAIIVGEIDFGVTGSDAVTLSKGSGGSLTFQSSSGQAIINFESTNAVANTISSAIVTSGTGGLTIEDQETGSTKQTISGAITANNGLTITNVGTLTDSGNISATGGISITNTSGTATFGGAITTGDTAGTSLTAIVNGGTLIQNNNAAATTISPFSTYTVNNGGILSPGANTTFADGQTNLGLGQITLNNGSTLQVNNANDPVQLANPIVLGPNASVTLANAPFLFEGGSITLNGSNTITVSSTTPTAGLTPAQTTIGETVTGSAASNTLTVAGAGTAGPLALDSGLTFSGSNPITLIGNTVDLSGYTSSSGPTFTVNVPTTISNVLIGTGTAQSLTVAGSSTLTLGGANTYTGGTNLQSGTILLGIANALPTSTVVTLGAFASSATLDLGGFNQTVSGLAVAAGATASNQIIGNSSTTSNATLTFAAGSGSSTFGGTIQDTLGAGTQTVAVDVASGTLALTGANAYSGGTVVTGTLSISADNNLGTAPSSPTAGQLVINGGTLYDTGSFTLNSNRGIAVGPSSGTGSGEIDVAAGQTLTYGGIIANNPGGSGSLVVGSASHTGTLVLSGSETFSLGTTLDAGTLAGSGTLGALTVDGGTLEPGTATTAQTLNTTGNLTIGSTAAYVVNANANGVNDQLDVTGTVNVTGAVLDFIPNYNATVGDQYTIIANNSGSAVVGTFNGLAEGALFPAGGQLFQITYAGGAGGNNVVVTRYQPPLPSTTTTLTSSVNPSVYGQATTFTATVTGTGTPTGTVDFYDGTSLLGAGTLNASDVATFSDANLAAVATHSITASYLGDSNDAPSVSAALTQTVSQASLTVTNLVSTANTVYTHQSVTLTATVTVTAPGGGSPTGSVTFFSNGVSIGAGTVSGGTAILTTTALIVGTDTITAQYTGDTNFQASAVSSSISVQVNASTFQWLGAESGDDWNTPANWTLVTGAGTYPNYGDIAQFTGTYTAAQTPVITVPITVGEIDFGGAEAVTIETSGGSLTLANPSGPAILDNSGSGTFTISSDLTGTSNLVFDANSSGAITVSGTIQNIGTITNSGTGTGVTTISGAINDNVTGVIEDSASSQLTLSAANSFTGGLTIDSGTVLASNATAAGPSGNSITLGGSTGGSAALLASVTIANPINLGTSAVGTLTIGNNAGTTTGVFSGAINLNGDNLTITATGTTGSTTVKGGITGTGNVTTTDNATTTGAITISTDDVENVGTLTNAGTGTGTTTISVTIDFNVTDVIQDSVNSVLALSGANAFGGLTIDEGTVTGASSNLSLGGGIVTLGSSTGGSASLLIGVDTVKITNPITLATSAQGTLTIGNDATGTGAATFDGAINLNGNSLTITSTSTTGATTVSGAITGTGNITITDDDTSGGTITISGGVDNTGTVTNAGTGGPVDISSVIGSNVTGVIQNSANSELVLSGANTFGGGLAIDNGTVDAGVSNATTVSGAAGPSGNPITLGSASGGSATLLADSFTVSNAINLGTNAQGTLTIGNDGTSTAPVFSGAISLNGDSLILTATGIGSTTVSGGITGSGNIAITDNGTTATTVIKTNAVNNTGTITNLGNGSGTTTISAGIGSNITAVTQNSTTSQLILSGTNTYLGPTTVAAGELEFKTEVSLYDDSATNWTAANLIVDSGATAVFAVGGSGQFTAADIAILSALGTSNGGFESESYLGFDTTSGDFTDSNPITDPNGGNNVLGLIKLGGNSLTLSANESYSGSTNILSGTLEFGSEAALYDDNTTNWTAGNLVVEPGATAAFAVGEPGQFTASDIATLSALGTANGGFESGSFLGIDTTSDSFTLANSITNPNGGSNILGVAKVGSNTLILTGNNTYTGPTEILDGTLQVSGSGTLGSPSSGLIFAPAASTSATLDFNNAPQSYQVASLSSSGAGTSVIENIAANQDFTVIGTTDLDSAFNVTGSGTFAISTSTGTFNVGDSAAATVNLSGLSNFTANVSSFNVNAAASTYADTLTLAAVNTITTPLLVVGANAAGAGGTGTLNLGPRNTFNVDTIDVGGDRGGASSISYNGAIGSVTTISGDTGAATNINIGLDSENANGANRNSSGTIDFTGGSVDATLGTVYLGEQDPASATTNTSLTVNTTGTLTIDGVTSVVSATEVQLGYWGDNEADDAPVTATGILNILNGTTTIGTLRIGDKGTDGDAGDAFNDASGTVNVSGGTLDVTTSFVLGDQTIYGTTPTQVNAALNITGGVVNSSVGITTSANSGAGATTILTLNGGTLNLGQSGTPQAIGVAGAVIGTLNFEAGTLDNVSQINGGTLGISGSGTVSTDNLTFGSVGAVQITPTANGAGGFVVTGSAALSGSLVVTSGNTVAPGTVFTIVQASGGFGGTTFTNVANGSDVIDSSTGELFQVNYTSTTVTLTADPALFAASYFDGALYEFDADTGALAATLIAPYSSSLLSGPAGLTVGPDGNLYISNEGYINTDTGGETEVIPDSILEYNRATGALSTFIPSTVLDAIATQVGASVFSPAGLTFGPDGNLYVSLSGGYASATFQDPTGGVVEFGITDSDGTLTYNGTYNVLADGTQVIDPTGLTFGPGAGNTTLYVCSAGTGSIVEITNATTNPTVLSTPFITFDQNPDDADYVNYPASLTWGPGGNAYVVDLGATSFQGDVLEFSATGTFEGAYAQPSSSLTLAFPSDAVFNTAGQLYTANLGEDYPPALGGSIYVYGSSGVYDSTLVSSSQFPDTGTLNGSQTSGISPSLLALDPATTTTIVASTPASPISPTTSISFTATVSDYTDVGTVTFYAGPGLTNPIGSPVPVVGGQAVSSATTLAGGSYTITAVYSGAAGFVTSEGTEAVTVISTTPTTTTLVENGPDPSLSSASVSFVLTVSSVSPISGETVSIEDASNGDTVLATPTLTNGTATFTLSGLSVGTHDLIAVYSTDGTNGPSQSSPVTQTVQSTFGINNVTATPSGVVLTFNAPIDPNTTVLYSSPGNTSLSSADVTVVGATTGAVRGSLVIDPTNPFVATFVQTAGLLAADTYTVTVTSAVQAVGGATLSGNYSTTLTVAATTTPVLSIPSFARGPGQSVELSNTVGIPVDISNAVNVTQASFTLTYDPTLLTIAPTGALTLSADATSAGLAITSYTIASEDAHHSILTVNVSGGTGFTASADQLLTITASVPFTAPYLDKSVLNLSGVLVNGGSAAGVSAVEAVAYLGDVLGTGIPDATDASLADQVGSGAGTGFSAFKDLDPAIIAGVDGGSFVNANDASLINEAGSGASVAQIPLVPSLPIGASLTFGGPDPYLYLSAVQGSAGQTVTETLYLDVTDPLGIQLTALDEAIGFDAGELQISDVRSASGLEGIEIYGTASTVDNGSGVLLVGQAFMGTGLPPVVPYGTDVAVLQFDVTLSSNVSVGSDIGLTLLRDGTINGQTKFTAVSDNEGALTWTPGMAPSNSGNAAVDGSVTVVPVAAPIALEAVVSTAPGPVGVLPKVIEPVRRVVPGGKSATATAAPVANSVSLVVPLASGATSTPAEESVVGSVNSPLQSPIALSQPEFTVVGNLATTSPVLAPDIAQYANMSPGATRSSDPGASLSLVAEGTNKVAPITLTGASSLKPSTSVLDEMYRQLGVTLGATPVSGIYLGTVGEDVEEEFPDVWFLDNSAIDLETWKGSDETSAWDI